MNQVSDEVSTYLDSGFQFFGWTPEEAEAAIDLLPQGWIDWFAAKLAANYITDFQEANTRLRQLANNRSWFEEASAQR